MTTPSDEKPNDSVPTPAASKQPTSKQPVAKKPAAKKPAAGTTAKPKTSVSATPAAKPAAKKVSKPAPAAPQAPAKTAPAKPAKPASKPTAAKTAARKPKTTSSAPATPIESVPKPVAPVLATPAAPSPTAPTANTDVNQLSPAATIPATATTPKADRAKQQAAKILKRAAKKSEKNDIIAKISQKAALYWRLTRMDRPIGTLLLLWPTLWSLWIAAKGVPSIKNLVIFVLGVIVMRAAGCVINDFADRKIDGKVERTKGRPLATGAVSSREAIGLFIALCLLAFALVLLTDPLTIKLSVGGLILAFCYPFMKRHTHLPQVVLGAAFAWGIPMAYAAEAGELPQGVWLIYMATVLWTVAYDTFYAMVDRDDDLKIGVKSTAILFGELDRLMTGVLQGMTIYALILVGNRFDLGTFYYLGLAAAAGLFVYQQWLIRFRARAACFKAFLNNNWVGVVVFAGIVADYALREVAS